LQHRRYRAADAPELESGALVDGDSLGIDQHRKTGRTQERDLAKIDDQTFGPDGEGVVEVILQRGSGEHVHLTGHVGHHNGLVMLEQGDPKRLDPVYAAKRLSN
jgi:hypothetical protein